MNKLYDRIYWHNNTTPALNESNLNSMSKAIDDIDDRVIELADEVVDDIADIHTWHDETYQYRQDAEQYASDAQGYASSASTSAQSADDSAEDSEAWAVGTRDGSDVSPSDPTYHNNAKYYSDQAEGIIEHATEGAEAWAVGERGGVPVSSSDETYHNNSKWYSNQSGASATQAQRSAYDCDEIKSEILNMLNVSEFTVDFTTGELIYTRNDVYNFSINTTTGNLEWEVVA